MNNKQREIIAEALDININQLENQILLESLNEWDSVGILSLIALIDEKYNIEVELESLNKLKTVEELVGYLGGLGE